MLFKKFKILIKFFSLCFDRISNYFFNCVFLCKICTHVVLHKLSLSLSLSLSLALFLTNTHTQTRTLAACADKN
jgi:hypothetical protein